MSKHPEVTLPVPDDAIKLRIDHLIAMGMRLCSKSLGPTRLGTVRVKLKINECCHPSVE